MIEMIRRIFVLAGDRRKTLLTAVVLNILQNCCTGGMYLFVMAAIVSLVDGTFGMGTLLQCSLCMAGLLVLRYALEYQVTRLQAAAGYEIMRDVRIRESGRLVKLPLGAFQAERLGGLTSIFTNDMSFVEMRCMATAANFIAGMTSVACLSIIMLFMDFRLAIIAMVGFVPAWFVYNSTKRAFKTAGEKRQEMEQGLIGAVLEYVSGMETIRSYRMGEHVFKEISGHLERYRDAAAAYELKAMRPMVLYQLFIRIGMGLIFLCGLIFYLNGLISLPVFLFFAIISGTYYQPVEALLGEFGILNIISLSLDHIKSLHSLPVMADEGRSKPGEGGPGMELATFAYKDGQAPAVDGVTAEFRPGTLTAVVGHSGSGKTTLLMLLARFWDVQGGAVSLGGIDVRDIPQKDLMAAFSVVFQDVYLFAGTIRENIRMGSSASLEEVRAAAKEAQIDDFIMSLPDGYDTVLGEGGGSLSGGEKQRISIARAMLKDAPIVILDEATASVDPENEAELQAAISSLTKGKTLILIAHRLKTVRDADQILVLNGGHIVQRGTHEELIAQPGLYADFVHVRAQANSWKLEA